MPALEPNGKTLKIKGIGKHKAVLLTSFPIKKSDSEDQVQVALHKLELS